METGGEAAAGVQDRRLLGDLLEKGFSPGWGGHEGGSDRRCLGSSLKLVVESLPSWCRQDRIPAHLPVWQSQSVPRQL